MLGSLPHPSHVEGSARHGGSSGRPPQQQRQRPCPARAVGTAEGLRERRDEYNRAMQENMQWSDPFQYHPERGLYYHELVPGLLCGTQPRTTSDIELLRDRERVQVILNLQQDRDLQHWGVDLPALQWRAGELGMQLVRRPAVDFDPDSLRKVLPRAVRAVAKAFAAGKRVYVHCTAGLGRAPAVCIAYLYWFRDLQLDEAYDHLTGIRPCGPKRDAVRAATYDLLDNRGWGEFQRLPSDAFAFMNDDDRARAQDRVLTWM